MVRFKLVCDWHFGENIRVNSYRGQEIHSKPKVVIITAVNDLPLKNRVCTCVGIIYKSTTKGIVSEH